jgi:hypothetical protein
MAHYATCGHMDKLKAAIIKHSNALQQKSHTGYCKSAKIAKKTKELHGLGERTIPTERLPLVD